MIRFRYAIALLALLAACSDKDAPTRPPPIEPPPIPPTPVGVYSIEMTGIGSDQMSSSVHAVMPEGGASKALTVAGAGIVFEQISSASFTEGSRTAGGQRYINFTYRVRNGTGVALNNLTLLLVSRASTIPGTPLSFVRKFDNTNADTAIAKQIVPTGAVTMGTDGVTMLATYPDVLQVLTEAEAAAIPPPGDVTNIFPTGYMVRHRTSTVDRALPVPTSPNQYDGILTVSFRVPLQATAALDVFSLGFQILAVTDTDVKLTESIEEAQDTGAVRRLRDRATSLGAGTVTVLNGSLAMLASVPDYPGQRQICSPRTAGPSGSPVTTINRVGAYVRLMMLRGGESLDPCAADYRTGSPSRPATNVPFNLTINAMDRYGNLLPSTVDSVVLNQLSGPPNTVGGVAALAGGIVVQPITYSDYGTSQLEALGRRIRSTEPVLVAGVTRTWTAGAGTTNWNTNTNWSPAAVPMLQDSVYIPVAAPFQPALVTNVSVAGVTVENVATISLGGFDLTASGNVIAGTTGGINNTTGRLFLAGTARNVEGKVPVMRVTGTYTASQNVTGRGPMQVDAGRMTANGTRIQIDGN